MTRRWRSDLWATIVLILCTSVGTGAEQETVLESARQIPVADEVDIVVVGGSTGAVAAAMVASGQPLVVSLLAALATGMLCGVWNGVLVAVLGIQPIIATLVLMVAGRGIAQLITEGTILTFTNPGFDLPPIDRLEAFDPNGRCVYTRVLVAIDVYGEVTLGWTYKYEAMNNGERTNGNWQGYFESV